MPFFSIIIPTYNRADMIKFALKSIINQTYEDWELIIIDDGSLDNTKQIVEQFYDDRIKYFHQQNQERSVARNNGISKAKGDWVCFLDSDDIYHRNHLETFYDFIKTKKFQKGLYFSGLSYRIYDKNQQYYNCSGKNNLEFILLNTIGVPRACCHKNILLVNQFDKNIRIGEDKELWCRIVTNHPMYYHTKKTFIELDHKERSIYDADSIFEHKKCINIILNYVGDRVSKKVKNHVLSDLYNRLSFYHLNSNILMLLKSIFTFIYHPQTKFRINVLLHIIMGYDKNYINKLYPSYVTKINFTQ